MADELRINGVSHSWGSSKFTLDGENYTGITSISYGDALEVEKGYGMGRAQKPRARSRGKYTPDNLVIKAQRSTAQAILDQLYQTSGNRGAGLAEVPIVIQFIENEETPITIEIEDARLVKYSASDEEGPAILTDDLEFDVMAIRRNGVTLFEENR